jgi:glucose/arabinose dehydrogenase
MLGIVTAVREETVMRLPGSGSSRARMLLRAMVVVTLLSHAGHQPDGARAADVVRLEPLVSGFEQPLFVTGAGTDNTRLFVVEKPGRIRVVKDGNLLATPFLNISRIVNDNANERGLLGLAFHPDYQSNRWFYVNYTNRRGDIVIARYTASDNPDRANAGSAKVILKIPHRKAANHNGGMLAFGPDSFLYIAVGDGGGGQSANGQKTTTLLGKILRIDVDGTSDGRAYAIPAGNPFADGIGGRPEIWAYGLRNPFRFSFDRVTGDMYIGDVGQHRREEIDFGESGQGGINFGWHIMEGSSCYKPPEDCPTDGLRPPIHEYSHNVGNVVTGGYVYRGSAVPDLVETYVFTDFGSRELWGLKQDETGNWKRSVLFQSGNQLNIAPFGESDAGELFAVDLVSGTLFRIEGAPGDS